MLRTVGKLCDELLHRSHRLAAGKGERRKGESKVSTTQPNNNTSEEKRIIPDEIELEDEVDKVLEARVQVRSRADGLQQGKEGWGTDQMQ